MKISNNVERLRSTAQLLAERLLRARHAAALTGAGVSAESGIPTFRSGLNALWRDHRPEDLATPEAFERDPALVTQWYLMRMNMLSEARPNPGHVALAQLQARFEARGAHLALLTQNVDGLHVEAGSRDVVELHGTIRTWRCMSCAREQHVADALARAGSDSNGPLPCSCGSWLRPGVVWFGESLPQFAWERAQRAASAAEVFIVVGTSAAVYPAAGLIGIAKRAGAFVVEINPEATDASSVCDLSVRARSGEFLPLVAECQH